MARKVLRLLALVVISPLLVSFLLLPVLYSTWMFALGCTWRNPWTEFRKAIRGTVEGKIDAS